MLNDIPWEESFWEGFRNGLGLFFQALLELPLWLKIILIIIIVVTIFEKKIMRAIKAKRK